MFLISSLSLIFLSFGIFLYIIIIYEKKRYAKFVAKSVETEGLVDGIKLGWGIRSPSFCLNYHYYDNYGTRYEDSKTIGIQSFNYKKGEKITVYYDPNNPQNTMIKLKRKGN